MRSEYHDRSSLIISLLYSLFLLDRERALLVFELEPEDDQTQRSGSRHARRNSLTFSGPGGSLTYTRRRGKSNISSKRPLHWCRSSRERGYSTPLLAQLRAMSAPSRAAPRACCPRRHFLRST